MRCLINGYVNLELDDLQSLIIFPLFETDYNVIIKATTHRVLITDENYK